jgi:hypothetical protein
MEANNTSETKIEVAGKYFRLTFVFNALKNPLSIFELIASSEFNFIFRN